MILANPGILSMERGGFFSLLFAAKAVLPVLTHFNILLKTYKAVSSVLSLQILHLRDK